jgi:ankyrin repeat protein
MSAPLLTQQQPDKDFYLKIYKKEIEEGECVDSPGYFGETPLTNACRVGHTECVRMLLDHGVDPNRTDKDGYSPLLWACYYYHKKIIKSVLDKTEIDADKELYTIYSNIFKYNPHQLRIAGALLESAEYIRDPGDIGVGFQIIASSANFDEWGMERSILDDNVTVRCLIRHREVNAELINQILKNTLMYRFDEIKDEVIDMLLKAGANRFI